MHTSENTLIVDIEHPKRTESSNKKMNETVKKVIVGCGNKTVFTNRLP
jgi:hypothetical protein